MAMAGMGVVPMVLRGPIPIRTSWGHTHPRSHPTVEPLDMDHWLHILEQKFQLLNVTGEQKVRFAAQQLLGSTSAWWDT